MTVEVLNQWALLSTVSLVHRGAPDMTIAASKITKSAKTERIHSRMDAYLERVLDLEYAHPGYIDRAPCRFFLGTNSMRN